MSVASADDCGPTRLHFQVRLADESEHGAAVLWRLTAQREQLGFRDQMSESSRNPLPVLHGVQSHLRLYARRLNGGAVCVALALAAVDASGQEAIRASMAGQDAAEARKRALAGEKFNVRLGPVLLRSESIFEVEATDNVRITAENEQADLIFRPQISTLTAWQVTEKNRLSLSLGVGYAKYIQTTEFDNVFIAPGSDLSFDVYVKDFVINFHDRFSYSQDVSGDPTISGVGSLSRFENVLGTGVTWDLNKVILGAGYDHVTYLATQPEFSYQSHGSELVNADAAFVVNPFTLAGTEIGAGMTDYDENILNDNQHVSGGLFFSMRVSEYSSLRVSLGYVTYSFESLSGTNQSLAPINGIYGDLSWRQRVSSVLSHSLSAGRSVQSGLFAEATELLYVRYDAQWRLFRQIGLGTSLSYEQFTETGGLVEEGNRYGFGLSLSRPLTRHWSTRLRYQFYLKASDHANLDYRQNRLVFDLVYAF
jgi:ribosomal protein S18 acetylase RimI-like enzyme